nr:PEP-CTERM sorting domain-containing protein [uncultured Rhodopila sp.]
MTTTVFALAAGILAASPASAAVNLLVNGGFETGDLSGWTLTGNTGPETVTTEFSRYQPENGHDFLVFGQVGSDGVLSQSFADVAGGTLTVTGYLAGDGSSPSDFTASIDGHIGFAVNPVPDQGYTEFTFTARATGFDTLSFAYRNDPWFDALDNISVSETVPMPVPEPGTCAILGAGLLGLGLFRRRRAG